MTSSRAAGLLRGPEDPQRATFLELFFDLAFVFTLSQLSYSLVQRLHWSGAFQTLVLLMAMWWVWSITTWVTQRLDPLRRPVQLLVILTLLGSLALAAALPKAFDSGGLVFAGVYVAIQLGRAVFLIRALRGSQLQRIGRQTLLWVGVSALPWIAGGLAHGAARAGLWTLALAVDYGTYALRFPTPGVGRAPEWQPPARVEHLAERFRQFFIISLGELILTSGETFGHAVFALDRATAFAVSIIATALLWWIYLYRAGELLPAAMAEVANPTRLGEAAAYGHLAMVAGVILIAASGELVIAHPLGHTPAAWGLVILGGPALFLAGRAVLQYAVFDRVSLDRPIGVLVLAALTPVTVHVPPLLAAAAATAVLAGVAIADEARTWGRPAEPSPGTGNHRDTGGG